jgi:hypothetical protein
MDKRSLEKRARRRLLRDRAVIDHLIDRGIDGKPRGGRVHSPTTEGGQPVEEQVRKTWDPRKGGGLPAFLRRSG